MPAPIAITMGDPAGVGPLIIAQAWQELNLANGKTFVIGARCAFETLKSPPAITEISSPDEVKDVAEGTMPLLPVELGSCVPGTPTSEGAQACMTVLERATALAASDHISGLVTAPIHKANLYSAGFTFPGHTEYLAYKAGLGPDDVVMMLASENLQPPLRVVPLTIHIPLSDVPKALTTDLIIRKTLITAKDLKDRYGIVKPRIALAGLNPHAGEDGAIGHEEATHIKPALWALEDMGLSVAGPLPADTLFHSESRANYDAVLCCYHDQALVPLKTLDFWGGVNITLGLPYVRCSPDHGTAYDRAAVGEARATSMIEAIKTALKLVESGQVSNAG